MSNADANAKLMELCNVLVGPDGDPKTQSARKQCATEAGRAELLRSYGIPAADGDPGYYLVNYEEDDNYDLGLRGMVDTVTQILAGKSYDGPVDGERARGAWQRTSLFDFLSRLTTEPALSQQLQALFPGGSAAEQQQFLRQHLPENSYAEQEALRAFLVEGRPDELANSVCEIINTFEARYQFFC